MSCSAQRAVDSGQVEEGRSALSADSDVCLLCVACLQRVVADGAEAVLADEDDTSLNGGVTVDLQYGGALSLSNSGDELRLVSPLGEEIDGVAWDSTWPVQEGAALNLDPGALDATANDDVGNWCASLAPPFQGNATGTPGTANASCMVPTSGAVAGDLLLTEILRDPDGSDSDKEWFEIANTTGAAISLLGWSFSDDDGDSFLVTQAVVVPANGYLVLGETTVAADNGGAPVSYGYGGNMTLGNADDELVITSPEGLEIDRVDWVGGVTWPNTEGFTMSLHPGTDDVGHAEVGHVGQDVGRVFAAEQRIQEEPVRLPVDSPGRIEVAFPARIRRVGHRQVQGDAQGRLGIEPAERADSQAVPQEQVVDSRQGRGGVPAARGVDARGVAEERRNPGLVERRPDPDPVTERLVHHRGIGGKALGCFPRRPAALVFQRLRQVPVVQRDPGRDPGSKQLIDQPRIKRNAFRVRRHAVGHAAGPGDGEAVGGQVQLLHQPHVLGRAVVVVAGNIAVVAVRDRTGHAAKDVPDGISATAFVGRALDLVRGGGRSPQEAVRKGEGAAVHPVAAPWLGAGAAGWVRGG